MFTIGYSLITSVKLLLTLSAPSPGSVITVSHHGFTSSISAGSSLGQNSACMVILPGLAFLGSMTDSLNLELAATGVLLIVISRVLAARNSRN